MVIYLRSTASSVVTGSTAMHTLSTTKGSAATDAGVKHAKNANTWQFVPGMTANATTFTIASTPNTQGWLLDSTPVGSFVAGTWTIQIDNFDSSASGTAVLKAQVWIVTATTSAVTQVTNLSGVLSSSSFTPSTTANGVSLTFNPGAVTIAANQFIYVELYLTMTAAGSSNSGTMHVQEDDSASIASSITTPAFSESLTATLSFGGGLASKFTPGSALTYRRLILNDGPVAYWQCNESSGNLADASGSGYTATFTGSGTATYGNTGPLAFNDTGAIHLDNNCGFNISASVPDPDTTNGFSIEGWAKPDDLGTTTDGQQYIIAYWRGTTIIAGGTDGTASLKGEVLALLEGLKWLGQNFTIVNTAGFNHVVFTYSASGGNRKNKSQLYFNGQLVCSDATAPTLANTARNIGFGNYGSPGANSRTMKGNIAHIALYNYPLSDEQIAGHYLFARGV